MEKIEMSRFDARLPKEQKELFEYAASLGGYRSLTDFIIQTLQSRANEIVEEHNLILGSKKDQEVFFNALQNPPEPNETLKGAMKEYKELFDE
ncbi:MAG: DUF1778 domain-containing protein [Bacteroidota bacterium]